MSDKSATPRVSIILTTLNGARYLRESVDSCLGQTERDLELLVVDGGSTDGTLKILDTYADPRLRVIHQVGNTGKLPGAINLGLAQAKGRYLTWMQDDSLYEPTAIARMAEVLDHHADVGHVYCDYWVIDADGGVLRRQDTIAPEAILKAKSDPCGTCFMIRRETREAVGEHDVEAYPTQDYDYRMRIAMKVRSYRLAEPLYRWRIHPYSLTGSRPWTVDARNDARIRLKLGLSDPRSYRKDLGEIDAAWAFERFAAKDYAAVCRSVISAIRLDPSFLRNRGMWSILVRSGVKAFGSPAEATVTPGA